MENKLQKQMCAVANEVARHGRVLLRQGVRHRN
jgi:hypothetical protein